MQIKANSQCFIWIALKTDQTGERFWYDKVGPADIGIGLFVIVTNGCSLLKGSSRAIHQNLAPTATRVGIIEYGASDVIWPFLNESENW